MIILRLSGGQANQMYEFASAYALANVRGEELVLDVSRYGECDRGYQLDYFRIPELKKIFYSCSDAESSIEMQTGIPASLLEHGRVYSDTAPSLPSYNSLAEAHSLQGDPIILAGQFFNRDRYYQPFWDEIRDFFAPGRPVPLLERFDRLAEGYETVGIHIRRTDFAVADWAFMPEADFFRAAICWYRHILSNPRFFVFSDDIEYAKSILGQDSSLLYVSGSGHNEAPFAEFLCLSRCRHKILSNDSTFSNLADELNADPQKTVVRRRRPDHRSRVRKLLRASFKWLTAFTPSLRGSEYRMETPTVARWAKKYRTDGQNPIPGYAEKIRDAVDCPDHQAALEKTDDLFMNVGALRAEDRKALLYRRFVALADLKFVDQALDLAYPIWHDCDDRPEFHRYFMEILCEAGFFAEAAVEAARCRPKILPPEIRDLYSVFSPLAKQRFLIAPHAQMTASSRAVGLAQLGLALRRLGHEVSFLFKTGSGDAENTGETSYIRKNKLLTTRSEVCLGCFQQRYEDVAEAQGLENFLTAFCASGPAVIVSRDPALCAAAAALSLPYAYPGFPEGDPESRAGGGLPPETRDAMERKAAFIVPSCRDEEPEYRVHSGRWTFRMEQRTPEYAVRQAAALRRWLAPDASAVNGRGTP